ncbi:MAG: potassium-transporting ATPase subunit KdpC [Deltaproteobacteria bacterium]|nr:potassium-transporting ATPase subunit KdpC [Deltaproteobacteria bacterium]
MFSILRPAVLLLALVTLITGVVYPLVVTGAAQAIFPAQASGSLIESHGRVVGSRLIGQSFDDPRYFWGRPSATGPWPYNAAASAGSNLGPTHPALTTAVRERGAALRAAEPERGSAPIPVDLVTASGSGLDPHISPAAALYQVHRVAAARGLAEDRVLSLVLEHVEGRSLGVLGEPRVNVLLLNVELDELARRGA